MSDMQRVCRYMSLQIQIIDMDMDVDIDMRIDTDIDIDMDMHECVSMHAWSSECTHTWVLIFLMHSYVCRNAGYLISPLLWELAESLPRSRMRSELKAGSGT